MPEPISPLVFLGVVVLLAQITLWVTDDKYRSYYARYRDIDHMIHSSEYRAKGRWGMAAYLSDSTRKIAGALLVLLAAGYIAVWLAS